MQTVAEEIKTWERTKGHPYSADVERLVEKLAEQSRRNGYNLVFESLDYSNTTFHPLRVPFTIEDAKKRYIKEGERAIDPFFVDVINKVNEYNLSCKHSDDYKTEISEVEVSDFMNFLYLAERIIKRVNYHERFREKEFWRWKKTIEVNDPHPIIVFTNPEKDGLLNVLKNSLTTALVRWNKGLKVLCYGNDSKEVEDFYEYINSLLSVGNSADFKVIPIKFKTPNDEYCGIWTQRAYIKGSFAKKPDLLGIENKINGEFSFDTIRAKCRYEHELLATKYIPSK